MSQQTNKWKFVNKSEEDLNFRYPVSGTIAGSSGDDLKSPSHRNATTGGVWGPMSRPPRGGPGSGGPSYSSITSINTSVRDTKNILEVRLEKQESSSFNLSMEDTEHLLKRLNIDSSHLVGVSACPEGRPVILITLHPMVDIARFLYRNESYVVKEGVRTTTISRRVRRTRSSRSLDCTPTPRTRQFLSTSQLMGL